MAAQAKWYIPNLQSVETTSMRERSFDFIAQICVEMGRPHLGIAAAALKQAVYDARDGDDEALTWLMEGAGREWLSLMNVEDPTASIGI
jgi:hypothetical protein